MLSNKIKSATVIFLFLLPLLSIGQENELNKYLSEKENKKITSAEKLVNKGNKVLEELSPMEEEIAALKNSDGRIKTRKINKLNKKIAEEKLKAAVYFEDGYAKHIKVLDKRLKEMEKAGDTKAGQIRDEADDLEKKARKQFNKSERLSEPGEMVELAELAQENQNKAIAVQETFLLAALANIQTEEEPVEELAAVMEEVADTTSAIIEEEVAMEDSISNSNLQTTPTDLTPEPSNAGAAVVAAGAGVATVATLTNESTEEPVETEIPVIEEVETPVIVEEVEDQNTDVFLSIQILADKQKASTAQITQAYSGNLDVIEKIGNGWYRYSVGKFTNIDTAKETMKNEGIKGFIVAYNVDDRISVKEAIELIGTN